MAYAGVQMFMEKLNQLINCNDIPFINHPSIIRQKPQFQLLYQELGSMTQTLFIHQHQDLQKLNDLKQRFLYTAEEAEYIVDLFLSCVHSRNTNTKRSFKSVFDLFLSCFHIRNLNLDDVRRSFKSVEVEFMKMDSSPIPQTTLNQSAPAVAQSSISRGTKKLMDEIFVGINRDAELIRDKLVEDRKKLDVVSIVGMGGIGKTTLATKVFNDGYVKYHFHVRVWVTVSQTYDKRAVLTQILQSISGQPDLEDANDSRLRELVHKNLMGKRYLIVIDDIWHIETWDNLKVFFPHDNNGSRILLTSRQTEVAKHASSDGLIHHLRYLYKEKAWELLCHKVFQGKEPPGWSIKPGMQIVKNCQGLPLAVVVIAGILAKETHSEEFWVEIAEKTGSYIVGDQNGCLETLALSYNHLPLHLRECFLYLGGFPEDHKFEVQSLIWLWVAEGFIQEDGNRSLELCLRKAKEEGTILITERLILSAQISNVQPYKPARMFINEDIDYLLTENLRSILCFSKFIPMSNVFADSFRSFELLRVLNLQKSRLNDSTNSLKLLVHLRYLAIWIESANFPSSICNLWGLQTLIYISSNKVTDLPFKISDIVNLRHLWSHHPYKENMKVPFYLPSIERPMNLQTISNVRLGEGVDNFLKCFPYVKQLTCFTDSNQNDFKSLTNLEKLKLDDLARRKKSIYHITFPATLRRLALLGTSLPWSEMSTIQSLPNLQVLKLNFNAFEGSYWNTDGQEFQQLKFLRLEDLDIELWGAYSTSFPCLKRLEIKWCTDLEEVPLEIADIPTLEIIIIEGCKHSVGESIRIIQQEQHDFGNYDLKVDIQKELHD